MAEFKLETVTPEEFHEKCKDRIAKLGLYKVVQEELAEIVCIAHSYGYMNYSETLERAQTILGIISIVENERPQQKGHWIYLKDCSNSGVYCSECLTKIFDHYPMKKKLSHFCGHCGAKMEGCETK